MKSTAAILAGLTLSAHAFATISYLAQSRSVSAYADGNPSQSQTSNAPDFLPFVATVQANATNGSAGATQHSALDPSGISLSASCGVGGQNAYNVASSSHFDITFSLDTATQYLLTGDLGANGGPGSVILSGQLTTVYQSFYGTIDSFGVLPAGTYRLQSDLNAYNHAGFDPPSSMSLTFTLVPSPAAFGFVAIGGLGWGVRRRR